MARLKLLSTFSLVSTFFVVQNSWAFVEKASDLYLSTQGHDRYLEIAQNLVDDGLYYSAVPFVKEYMASGSVSKNKLDAVIDDIIINVGVKQFEVFPQDILSKVNTPMVAYIRAKKNFRKRKYDDALKELSTGIPSAHSAKPFALNLEATIFSIKGNLSEAIRTFEECVSASEKQARQKDDQILKDQLYLNRDYCLIGIPRAEFQGQKYEDAYSSYLDLPKSSPIWPEILFEEAWNSFYMKDYNRALGKLVTYKAPVFSYVFLPEIDILRALTYMELCLWDDARKVVDDFYAQYDKEYLSLKTFLNKNSGDLKYYYNLAKGYREGKYRDQGLLSRLVSNIVKDGTYLELFEQFARGRSELAKIKKVRDSRFKRVLASNLKETLLLQRDLIGSYVKRRLNSFRIQMSNSFEGMSYIKLEILSQKKGALYGKSNLTDRQRGDILFLKRNEKQYFWTFNGEFWADELGDYVFALKSECRG